jgi:hypothetical protein
MIYSDPAVVSSNYKRKPRETYYTQPWITRALLDTLQQERIKFKYVWEPACGRGDMVSVFKEYNYGVAASDIDLSVYEDSNTYKFKKNFIETNRLPSVFKEEPAKNIAIITNPPYNISEKFINHALGFDVKLVAMLLRNEWDCAKTRTYLFNQDVLTKRFAMKIVLTSRPRWDDWRNKTKPDKSPRHNYGWYVWIDGWKGSPTIRYASRDD